MLIFSIPNGPYRFWTTSNMLRLSCQIMNLLPQLPHQPQLLQTGNGHACSEIYEASLLSFRICISPPHRVFMIHCSQVNNESLSCFYDSVLSSWGLLKMARHRTKWTFILVATYKYSCKRHGCIRGHCSCCCFGFSSYM